MTELAESSNNGILVLTFDSVCSFVNKSAIRLLGIRRAEAGLSLDKFLTHELASSLIDKLRAVKISGTSMSAEQKVGDRSLHLTFIPISASTVMVTINDLTELRQRESILVRSRDFYMRILDEVMIPIWKSDKKGHIDYFNKSWLDFTGRKLEEQIGDGWKDDIHPDDLQQTCQLFDENVAREQPYEMEYRLRHHDGTYRWISESGLPIFDSEGDFEGFIGTCIDIDKRKKAEDEIIESGRRYRTLYDFLSDAVFLIDPVTLRIIESNNAACDLYGYEASEFSEMMLTDLSAEPEKSQKIVEYHSMTIPFRLHRKKDGSVFPIEATTSRMSVAGTETMILAVRDITRRKLIEDELQSAKEQLENLIDGASEVIVCLDSLGNILLWNDTIANVTGVSRRSMLYRNIFSDNLPETLACFISILRQVCEGRESRVFENQLCNRHGCKDIVFSCSRINKNSSNPQLLIIGTDVTSMRSALGRITQGSCYSYSPHQEPKIISLLSQYWQEGKKILHIGRKERQLGFPHSFLPLSLETLQSIPEGYDVIMIDRLEYVKWTRSYKELLLSIYSIADTSKERIVFICLEDSCFTEQELWVLRKELESLPEVESAKVDDRKMEILRFVEDRKKQGLSTKFKDIGLRFKLSKKTTQMYLMELAQKGLIRVEKVGKVKYVHLT